MNMRNSRLSDNSSHGSYRACWSVVLLLAIAASAALVGCRETTVIPSQWTSSVIQINGEVNQWSGIAATRLEDKETSLAIANDSTYLYLLLRFRDPMWARMIRRTGLTIWLDPTGDDPEYFELRFRGGPPPAELHKLGGELQGAERDSMFGDMRPEMMPPMPDSAGNQLICQVKDRIVEKVIPLDGGEGPAVASAVSGGMIYYELRIPLEESRLRYYGLGAKPGQEIAIKAVWGNPGQMRRPESGPGFGFDGGDGGGGFGGGRPGGGGGGMPPGGGPGGMGQHKALQKQEIVIKTTLAQPGEVTIKK